MVIFLRCTFSLLTRVRLVFLAQPSGFSLEEDA